MMMTMHHKRKGIMFSVILFFLAVTLIGLIAIQRSLITYRRERMHIEMRIKSLNNMYDSLIRDAGSTMDTSLRRAMHAAFNNVSSEGVPLSKANETLKSLVINGTLDGTVEDMMENATLPYWEGKMEEVGMLKGFYINMILYNDTLEIKPYDSFFLLAEIKMDINITDMQGVAALNRSTSIKRLVSIEDLEDPLYPLKTNGFTTNTIVMSPYIENYTQLILTGNGDCAPGEPSCYEYEVVTNDTTFPNFQDKILVVSNPFVPNVNFAKAVICEIDPAGGINVPYVVDAVATSRNLNGTKVLLDVDSLDQGRVWYIENFQDHVENQYYQHSETGASYLDRLEGKTTVQDKYKDQTNNDIGLESFINKRKITAEIPVDGEKTNIDYLYFRSGDLDGDRVKGISTAVNWFRIDDVNDRQENYGIHQIIE